MITSWKGYLALLVLVGSIVAGGALFTHEATGTQIATPAAPAVVREVLSQGEPAAAPGEVLQLVRYTIPPGLKLPVHTHPGMQSAWLESGTLEYTVVSDGVVTITRAATGDGTPGASETLSAGQTTTFTAGDAWTEPEGMVHFAESKGDEPVVILVASLFAEGEPASTVVEAATSYELRALWGARR